MAEAYHEELLALNRELGDRHGEIGCLCHLGRIAQARGDFVLAQERFAEALDILCEEEILTCALDSFAELIDVCDCRLNDDSDPIETLWSWSANLDSHEAYLADGRSDLKSGRWIGYAQQPTKFRLSR